MDLGDALARFYRKSGDRVGEASERANVADLAMEAGDIPRATEQLRAAFDIPDAVASSYLLPGMLKSAGALAGCRERYESAVRLIAGSSSLYEAFGLSPDPGDALTPRVWQAASQALGPGRTAQIEAEPGTKSQKALVALARRELAM